MIIEDRYGWKDEQRAARIKRRTTITDILLAAFIVLSGAGLLVKTIETDRTASLSKQVRECLWHQHLPAFINNLNESVKCVKDRR